MPLYEYECEGGHRFEELSSIEGRYDTVCPLCKHPVHLQISAWGRVLVAAPFTVVGHSGAILSITQSTERIPIQACKSTGKVVNI